MMKQFAILESFEIVSRGAARPHWESVIGRQGLIQAILMSTRRYEKLNLVIEFSNSIPIKIYFKAYKNMLT